MPHHRLRFICLIVTALLISIFLQKLENNEVVGSARYQQHLQEASETDLQPCDRSDETQLCTHLPIIRIDTGNQKIPGKPIYDENGKTIAFETTEDGSDRILVDMDFIDTKNTWHHADDTANYSSKAYFHIRGNSSRSFDKSNYRISLVKTEDPTQANDLGLLGMRAESDWALHGPFLDKTLIRNYMWMNLSSQLMDYVPEVRFCEVILDHQYIGVYVLMETIKVSKNRLSLREYEQGDAVMSYCISISMDDDFDDAIRFDDFSKDTYRMEMNHSFGIVYPKQIDVDAYVKNYIIEDLNEIERKLYLADPLPQQGIENYLDVNSFVDYYLLEEFMMVSDTFSKSTYFHKDARGKLTAGPVWDFNNNFDNFFNPLPYNEFILSQKGWFGQLMKSESFVRLVISRWKQLRQTIFSDAFLKNYVAEVDAYLGSSVERNFEIWGYSFDYRNLDNHQRRVPLTGSDETLVSLNPSSFAQANQMYLETMEKRGQWMDAHIESLLQYCSESKNAGSELD